MYCCMGQEGELPGAGASCNSVRRCCVHAKVVSSFLRIWINVLRLILWWKGWGWFALLLCPWLGKVGGTPHKCTAFRVMCAQRMRSVRLAVRMRGALIKLLWIWAASLFWSSSRSLACREHSLIACCSRVGKSPQSALRAVWRIGPSESPIHSASNSSRAFCTLCICAARPVPWNEWGAD